MLCNNEKFNLPSTAILNVYVCNNRAIKYVKQKWIKLKGQIDNLQL